MDDTDRALKFGLFLDSLCAGVSAMPQAARAGRASHNLRCVSSLRATIGYRKKVTHDR